MIEPGIDIASWTRALMVGLVLFSSVGLYAQKDSSRVPAVMYTDKGFAFTTPDSNYQMHIEWRGQFRFAYPTDNDPITLEDFGQNKVHLNVNRARMKVGGHAVKPYFKYYLEYELFAGNLLDFRLMYEQHSFFKVKVGQWKVQYNRERIISSGKQQTMERSILTRPFTVDRQQGLSVFGRVGQGEWYDFNYWVSTFMGTGRGASENDDGKLMYMTRFQWNFMGESLGFSGSDLDYHERLGAIAAIAFVTNQSPYTRFSQAGGGQLPGFEEGDASRYRVNQFMVETAGKYHGFAWQQEFHWKRILDRETDGATTMLGNLVQVGYFPHYALDFVPQQLEIYMRHAFYNPDESVKSDIQNEFSFGFNWFVGGHRNKFTAEMSFFKFEQLDEQVSDDNRFRLQWDVSF